MGLRYSRDQSGRLVGFCDSDYAGCPDTRQSTSAFVFLLSNGAVTWASKRQNSVAQSSSEAEYVSAGQAAMEAEWLRNFLEELGHPQKGPTVINCDSTAAIAMSRNPVHRERTKHIAVKAHYLRDQVKNEIVDLTYVHTSVQAADALTKSLAGPAHLKCTEKIGVVPYDGPIGEISEQDRSKGG